MSGTPEMGQSVARNDDELLGAWASQAMCIAIRGIVSCFPHQRLEKMLMIVSAAMGQQIAHTYAGDELSVHKLRKMCREAFESGIKSVPVVNPNAPKPTDTATIIG